MKQLLQNYLNGEMAVHDLPAPRVRPGGLLVATRYSLISAGTERALVELARKSLIEKARSRPDLVRKVIDKARTEGVLAAYEKSMQRLDSLNALGYSSAGVVLDVGDGVDGFRVGAPVACAGIGYASHAEIVFVPRNLAAAVPPAVSLAQAAFTTVGAIALQGVRTADPRLGETVALIGLGLVGLLAAQLLRAAGCRVVGLDLDPSRCALASSLGCDRVTAAADDLPGLCRAVSGGLLADAALVTAASESDAVLETAAEAVRDRGKVVVVGQVGMRVPRKPFYDKELSLAMSRSYGPGRYDRQYEEKGVDYPIGYVRWTENRNMQAFLGLVADGRVALDPLITHRFPIDEAVRAYDVVTGKTSQAHLGVLLEYDPTGDYAAGPEPRSAPVAMPAPAPLRPTTVAGRDVSLGIIGAGAFAMGVLLPALQQAGGVRFAAVCSQGGVSAYGAAKRFKFDRCVSDVDDLLSDSTIDAVVIATRPDSHANLVERVLAAGKHVFVEKPLAVNQEQLQRLAATAPAPGQIVMIGFNRRFAPQVRELKQFFGRRGAPFVAVYRVNAGYLPPDDWQLEFDQGGGRLIGECGHFIDALSYLADAAPVEVYAGAIDAAATTHAATENAALTIRFADGSVGALVYTTGGTGKFSKERLEVFSGGRVAFLDDFHVLSLAGQRRRRTSKSWLRQDKGHRDQVKTFLDAVRGSVPAPVAFTDYVLTTWSTLQAVRSIRTRRPEAVSLASLRAAEGSAIT